MVYAEITYFSFDNVCQMLSVSPRTLRRYAAILQKKLGKEFDRKKGEPGFTPQAVAALQKFCELRRVNKMPVERCAEYLRVNGF
ncbi:MerR family transcriptional regulator [[Phormidium] sp. LEGE 05292]|uniref:MerR family transcriptional regulator n=1 Tax=[Phormidium] sp. LEGE 05292 TaxID=767427 RepID=UPI001D142553|nr:MerR family transcriptional regulator [Phormidium sp. LEGE 05292]